jgi:hypothetical protein
MQDCPSYAYTALWRAFFLPGVIPHPGRDLAIRAASQRLR